MTKEREIIEGSHEELKMDRTILDALRLFKSAQGDTGPSTSFDRRMLAKLNGNPSHNFTRKPFIAVALFSILIVAFLAYTIVGKGVPSTKNQFVKTQYLPKPSFANTVPSSIAKPSEFSLKSTLPSLDKVIEKSKLTFISLAYAADATLFPIYRAARHELTEQDAKDFAKKFGLTDEPQKDGTQAPAYYGYTWSTENDYLLVSGGSGTGGFDYYAKKPAPVKIELTDEIASQKAKEFLTQKGIIDDSYSISGILTNVSDISKRSGFRENHKQIYFRKNLNKYSVIDWIAGGGSPITDRIEVWVGASGRIIYATHESYWTTIDEGSKVDYPIKEPPQAFEDVKNGRGRLAWIDYDAIDVFTGGYGPMAPGGNFAQKGLLKNVVVTDAKLVYYHEQRGIEDVEYYQPIYILHADATLDWQSDYDASYEADKYIIGKRTHVAFVIPAVQDKYFYDANAHIDNDVAIPTITQPIQPVVTPTPTATQTSEPTSIERHSFILKLGFIEDVEDPKRNVTVSWEDVPGTVKYNIYLKHATDADYNTAAFMGSGNLSEVLSLNKYEEFYIKVHACKAASVCIESNEIYLPAEQKQTFYLKLGVIEPKDDPKEEITLSWSKVPSAIKYNVYLRNSPTEDYGAAIAGIADLSYRASVNRHNDNYFTVQACSGPGICETSNEIFVPKQ